MKDSMKQGIVAAVILIMGILIMAGIAAHAGGMSELERSPPMAQVVKS